MLVSLLHIKLQTLKILLYTFVVQSLFITQLYCQNISQDTISNSLNVDSTIKTSPSIPFDTVDINIKDDAINSPVHYKALDSIVYDIETKMLYLYGNAEMKYDKTQVNAERVAFDWNTQTLSANGIDSLDKKVGTPVLVQEGKTYEAKKMEYNFRTQKGKIYHVVTEDNGAFIHSEIVKKSKDNSWLSYKAKYTTCTDKEHPHFYIQARKAKVIPDKIMVSGPANLVISGINTPLVLPFAIFPIKSGRRSGIIMPLYGVTPRDGSFFLKDGGYYWAANDYLSMGFTGEIVTDGTFGVKVASKYKVRYKSSGNILLSYRRKAPSDPIKYHNDVRHDYLINWSHRMDTKADPNNNFSANINIKSSSYNQNSLIQNNQILEVINSSHLTYSRRFNGKPYNLTISASQSQSNKSHVFSLTLPEIAFNINKITPFKSKITSKRKKFYEKIGFTYGIRAKATATSSDTTFFTKSTLEKINYGINQSLKIDATYSIFKFFNFTPYVQYEEQWMFKEEELLYSPHYDVTSDTIVSEKFTESSFKDGFFARRNFSTGASLQTKLTGMYNFNKGNVKAIRHILTPRISYTYHPDFSKPLWNYYDSYYHKKNDEDVAYNKYANTRVYGVPGKGEQNTVSFSLGNSIEMKVLNKKDTTNTFKKIPLLKSLSISTGYNFAGDSISKFQNVKISASTSFLNNLFGLRADVTYNPYSVDMKNKRISKTYMETHQKPLRFVNFNLNVDFNLRAKPKSKSKKTEFESEYGTVDELEYISNNPDLYYSFDIPWSFRVSYHMSLSNGITGVTRDSTVLGLGNVSFGGDINITPKWKINVNSGYNIRDKDLTLTTFKLIRDLHCWEMSLDWTAYPIQNQFFTFELRVKSPLLQDLKLTKKHIRNNYNSSF